MKLYLTYILSIYFLLICIIYKVKIYNLDYKNNCISLIIPSTQSDFLRCYKQFFYLSNSFLEAKEVIIVISSVTNKTMLKDILYSTKIRNRIVLGLRESHHNAASNRNYGYELSTCEIISFFDVDDVMSENRLSIVYNILKMDKTVEFILHKYSSNCKEIQKRSNNIDVMKYKYNFTYDYIYRIYKKYYFSEDSHERWCCKYIDEIKKEPIHNGWPTMRSYIFDRMKYNISYSFGQDSDFNSNVILMGFNVVILNVSLGYYKKDNLCNNYNLCF